MTEYDLQEYADIACLYLAMPSIPIQVKGGIRAGRARVKTRKITIPAWATKLSPHYAIYYVLHEVAHFRFRGHGIAFKEHEQSLCKMAGITIDYAKAYPKKLYYNGQLVYNSREKERVKR